MRSLVMTGAAAALAACGPGSNAGDCDDTLLAGDLVVTEVFADAKAPPGGSGTDEGKEWFEIYNATSRPVELKGLTITHGRPDGSRAKSHVMADITIAPGQYLTLGNSADDLLPAYVDYGYGADLGDMFNTDGGKLALACGGKEIDAAIYDTIEEGHSRQLTASQPPDYTLNDDPASWCEASAAEFEAGNFGTPGAESDCSPIVVGQCSDGGVMRDAVAPTAGDLVITEVMPNPAGTGDDMREWFEIQALNAFDLNGLGLDRAGDTRNPDIVESPDCVHLEAGELAVFARNADSTANGLPVPVRATFGFSLVDGTAAAPGDVRVMNGADVLDAITWTSTRSGRTHSLDPGSFDPTANDLEANFCDGTTSFGGVGDLGTPGADNPACPVSTAGMCDEGGGSLRPIVKPAAGQLVITEFLANPANVTGFTDAQREWIEIQNTGATAFDLNELSVARVGGNAQAIVLPTCKSVAPGEFALFARSVDPSVNAMLPEVDVPLGIGLVDSGGDIEIRDGATILDTITWTSVTSGVSKQLDPDLTTTTDNDAAASFCAGTTPYGDNSNMGTPKAANNQCP